MPGSGPKDAECPRVISKSRKELGKGTCRKEKKRGFQNVKGLAWGVTARTCSLARGQYCSHSNLKPGSSLATHLPGPDGLAVEGRVCTSVYTCGTQVREGGAVTGNPGTLAEPKHDGPFLPRTAGRPPPTGSSQRACARTCPGALHSRWLLWAVSLGIRCLSPLHGVVLTLKWFLLQF